jgi:protoporphyrinogen oxidase
MSYAIVGGGMLGLTLALRLKEMGNQVKVFEAAPSFGGLASSWQVGGVEWDRYYHVTLLSDANTRALVRQVGLEAEMTWSLTRTGCYGSGRLVSVSNAIDFIRFPLLGMLDKMRLGLTIIYASRLKNWRALEQVSVECWLRRWSGNRTYETFWRPLLTAKLGSAHERTSAAFIWATIRRLYAARTSGLREEKFGYVKGGYSRFLSQLTELLQRKGVVLVSGARLDSIAAGANGLEIKHQDGGVERFDRVIVTAAPKIAASLCPGLRDDERRKLTGIDYLGIVCASVLLTRPLGGFYVTNLIDSGFPFTGIIEMSALVPPRELNGHHLVYLPRYHTPEDPFPTKSDDEIRDSFLAGLKRIFTDLRDEEIVAFRVSRASHVMPIPTLGYSQKVAPFETSVPDLYLVNSSQIVNGTLNVNETAGLANRAIAGLTAS